MKRTAVAILTAVFAVSLAHAQVVKQPVGPNQGGRIGSGVSTPLPVKPLQEEGWFTDGPKKAQDSLKEGTQDGKPKVEPKPKPTKPKQDGGRARRPAGTATSW